MDEKQLDPMQCSVDEMREHFENYKIRSERNFETYKKLTEEFCLDKDLEKLQTEVRQMRLDMNKLQRLQLELSCWREPDAIEELPFSINNVWEDDINSTDMAEQKEQLQEKEEEEEKQLLISCGSSSCLFEHCRRRVDSQLLLLHYLSDHSDHSDDDAAFLRCHKISKGQRIVLSFETRRCPLRQNQVIGLLAYQRSLTDQQHLLSLSDHQLNNSEQNDVPIVVLICRTSAKANPRHGHARDQVFVLWLVTPLAQLQLNATLRLCGRNAAVQANTKLAVRPVDDSQNRCDFMPVDANYWRLSNDEIQKITNDFRDELHLEIGITELTTSCQ
ncbi:uncharacterized protein LOC117785718 [Drosophila innubila]|uniref:uncharacterized protein LOC117785718 n=1 Tax=Drosophila innubila TaxID=198719 RepID=UPI00148B949E|nr:uncharacterized protein LOC117785718 [Drosophila innubila]